MTDQEILGAAMAYTDKHGGGGGGTTNYNELSNKPQIAGTTLSGNKSLADLGIASATALGDVSNAVTAITDGQTINSFADVETALSGKQNTITAGDDLKFSGSTLNVEVSVPYIDEYDLSTDGNGWTVVTKKHKGEVVSTNTYQSGIYATYDIDGCFTLTCGGSPYWQVALTKASTDDPVGTTYGWSYGETPTVSSISFELAETGTASEFIADLNDALANKQDTLTFDDVPTANSNNPVRSGGVKSAIDTAVASAYHHAGTKTCAELVAGLLVAGNEGNVYNMTDSGTTTADFIEGQGQPIKAGDNVGIAKISDGVYKFDLLSGFVDTTNFVQKSETAGLLKNDGTVDTTIQGDVSTLKSGFTTLDNEVNGDAVTYPYADVITIEDAVPANLADCSVKIEPVQDLHGYDKPWVGGAWKNKLPMTLDSIKAANTDGTWSGNEYTYNGIKITVQTDNDGNVIGIYTPAGTPSAVIIFNLYKGSSFQFDIDNTYILNGCPSGGSSGSFKVDIVYRKSGADNVLCTDLGVGASADYSVLDGAVSINCRIVLYATEQTAKTFYPMIRLSTEQDATFAPYSNECPITGHTEASVQRDGVNMWNGDVFKSGKAIDNTGAEISANNYSLFKYVLPVGNYTVSFADTDKTSEIKIARVGVFNSDDSVANVVSTNNYTSESGRLSLPFSVTDKTQYAIVSLRAVSVVDVQLELGSTATPYVPYAGKTYTILFKDAQGQTITAYKGGINFKTGVMTATHKYVDLGDFTYQTSSVFKQVYISDVKRPASNNVPIDAICEQYRFVARYSAENDGDACVDTDGYLKVRTTDTPDGGFCYELATPTTIQLTPQQIQLLKGTNTLTASTGQISVTVNGVSGSIGALQTQANDTNATLAELAEQLPTAPTTDGAYVLTVTVADGTPTYSWESAT